MQKGVLQQTAQITVGFDVKQFIDAIANQYGSTPTWSDKVPAVKAWSEIAGADSAQAA